MHLFSIMVSAVGVALLLISRAHYTIDVIISYWISTRVFWTYHTLAAFPSLRVCFIVTNGIYHYFPCHFAKFKKFILVRFVFLLCHLIFKLNEIAFCSQNANSHYNHLSKFYWYRLFVFMEGNLHRPVPRRYYFRA